MAGGRESAETQLSLLQSFAAAKAFAGTSLERRGSLLVVDGDTSSVQDVQCRSRFYCGFARVGAVFNDHVPRFENLSLPSQKQIPPLTLSSMSLSKLGTRIDGGTSRGHDTNRCIGMTTHSFHYPRQRVLLPHSCTQSCPQMCASTLLKVANIKFAISSTQK